MKEKDQDIYDFHFSKLMDPNLEINIGTLQDIYRISNPRAFKPHRLHFYAIILFEEKSGFHEVDFQTYEYQPDSIFFISQGQVISFEQVKRKKGWVICFSEIFLHKHQIPLNLFSTYSFLSDIQLCPLFTLNLKEKELLVELIKEIKKECHHFSDNLREDILASLIKYFLLKSEAIRYEKKTDTIHSSSQILFNRFKCVLEKDYNSKRYVKDYASLLGISTKHLNYICKTSVNFTSKQFIDHFVLLKIKRYLIGTEFSVKEISHKMGIKEVTNTVKFFKKLTGVTPLQFRKNCLSGE